METTMLINFQKITLFFVISGFIISISAHHDIRRLINQIEKKIDQVQIIINKSGDKKVRDILQQGIRHYEVGIIEYQRHNKKKAIEELNIALNLIKKAEAIAKGVNNNNIDKLIMRLSLKIQNIQRLVHEIQNHKARDILQKGIEQYNTGIELLSDNNPKAAYAKLVISAKLIARAEAIARDMNSQDTDKIIKRLGTKIQSIEKMVKQSHNQQVKELYDKCVIFYQQGIESKAKGRVSQTLVELNHAKRLINHIEILVKEILKLIQNIEHAKIKINNIKKSVEQSQNQNAEIILNEGINHLNKAQESVNSGKINIARNELSITIKLIEKVKSMTNN
jgi:hypothetical protein